MTKYSDRILGRFSAWFASAAGVWQTAIATALIVAAERIFPHTDPNGFWLLYALTVYSGVTQPALAYVGVQASEKLDLVLEHLRSSGDDDLAEDRGQTAMLTELRTDFTALQAQHAEQGRQLAQALRMLAAITPKATAGTIPAEQAYTVGDGPAGYVLPSAPGGDAP